MLVHVVDAAAEDPAADYWIVREELRMYAPLYCQRPHVVALNKMDLPDAYELKVRSSTTWATYQAQTACACFPRNTQHSFILSREQIFC